MKGLFNKKPKKPLKSSRRHISLGIPVNIAAGPLGFRAELDIGAQGQQSRSYHDLEAGGSDQTVVLDENDARASRIVFQDKKGEDQGSPAQKTSTVDGTGHGNDPKSEFVIPVI